MIHKSSSGAPNLISPSDGSSHLSKKTSSFFHIALMLPEHHTLSSRLICGFTTMLRRCGIPSCAVRIHTTGHDMKTIREKTKYYLSLRPYDLILSYGVGCTLAAYELTQHLAKPPHIVFAGFRNPISHGLIKSFKSSGNHLTGITTGIAPYDIQFEEMSKCNVFFKRVLVIYNSDNQLLNQEIDVIEQVCFARKLTLDTFEINNYEDYKKSIGSYLANTDLVLTLRDSAVLIEMETIASLCRLYNVKLCASDWYSVDEGATMGFGVNEEIFGMEAAYKASLILTKSIHPSRIPTITPHLSYSLRQEEL